MSTRGTWGYVIDGEEKLTYNHSDSYPSWLGVRILEHVQEADLDELRGRVRALRMVSEDSEATPEDIQHLTALGTFNGSVSTGEPTEWYSLLRNVQGEPEEQLEAGVMIDGADFPQDSLFCEWAYVIDLDHERLEVYQGFQTEPHSEGRFAGHEPTESSGQKFYPVRLVATYALQELPDSDAFENTLSELEEA